ncbi:MAG: ral secretion pathway protein [Pedosphaera sp.]|nr:ral secretion pathway protein [Pedosphaera sp.]
MKLRRHHKRGGAFTLLEILIALGLLSMVVIAIYSSWNSILKGKKVAMDAAAAAQRTRITMRTLKDSLLCACMFNQNARYYTFLADSEGDYASLSFVARLPKSFPRSGKFGDLDVRRLTFTVENGPESKKQLVLRQNPLLMDPDKEESEHPLILANDVNKFIVEFIDPQTGDWTSEWTRTNQLPREVRLTVALGRLDKFSSEAQEALIGTVALPGQPVRPEWQVPGLAPVGTPPSKTPGAGTTAIDNRGIVK